MRFHNTSNKKAFSLIELSIVVLIIGIIIAGITKSSQVLDLYKLSSARTQTQSSPVNSIKNLLVWYEATSENSFIEKETDDFASLTAADITLGKGIISTWFDISSTAGAKDNLTQTTSTARPQYLSNCINDLPCVNFDGTDDILNFAGSKITDIENSNYTIFIINKKTSTDNSSELIIGTTSPQNEALSIGYDKNNLMTWGHTSSSYSTSDPDSIPLEDNKPTLHVFVNEVIDGFDTVDPEGNYFYYLNGSPLKEDLAKVGIGVSEEGFNGLTSYVEQTVGGRFYNEGNAFYTGGVGEIIIFNRALKSSERDSVENYLIRKWQISPDNS